MARRPPHRQRKFVHILKLSPELEDRVDDFLDHRKLMAGVRAGGEALKGALSHPVGYLGIATLIGGLLIALGMPGHFDRVRARDKAAGMAGIVPYPDEVAENVGDNINMLVKAAEAFWNFLHGGSTGIGPP